MQKLASNILFALIWVVSLLPIRLLYLISDIIWLVMFVCPPLRYRKDIVQKNLALSFPDKDRAWLRRTERRFYHQFLDQLFETFKSATMSRSWIRRHMRIEGMEYVEKEFEKGNSIVLYLGHTGNWEWVSSLPLHVMHESAVCCQVYHPLHNQVIDNVMLRLRERYGAESIALKHVYRRLLEIRKSGRPFIIGMISDQVPLYWETHYWGMFMNHNTPFLTGSEQLARKMSLSTCFGYMSRERRGYYVFKVVPMTSTAGNIEENGITDQYVKLLEENIRENPHLWLWTHNRWKRTWEGYQSWLKNELKSNRRNREKEL